MKDISETHPSLKTSTSGFGWKVATDFRIQEATIDKAVLRLKFKTLKEDASSYYEGVDMVVLRSIIEDLEEELGLEEEK
jgi:hypothetical protein